MTKQTLMSFPACFKLIAGLGIPMALSYTFSVTIVAIGLLGGSLYHDAVHVAAITLIMTSINTLMIIGFSPLFAMSIMVSNLVGSLRVVRDEETRAYTVQRISAVNRSGLQIVAVIAPIIFGLMFFSQTLLVKVMGQPEEAAAIVQGFLRIYAFAVPAVLWRVCLEQILFSFAKAKATMCYSVISFAVGTVFAYALAHGVLGFPGMGLQGIAIGYTVECYLTAIFFAYYLRYQADFAEYNFFKLFNYGVIAQGLTRQLLKIGAPIAFTIINEMLLTFVLVIIAGRLGTAQLAALNFSMQIIFFVFIISASFGQACCQEVSRQIGAHDVGNARRVAIYGLWTTLLCLAPLCGLLVVTAPVFVNYFIAGHPEVVTLALFLVPLVVLAILCDAARYNILQVLRALHDHVVSMLLSTVALWFSILLSIGLGLYTQLGLRGVIYGYLIGIICATLLLIPRWWMKLKFQ